jgi:hypothetical protein
MVEVATLLSTLRTWTKDSQTVATVRIDPASKLCNLRLGITFSPTNFLHKFYCDILKQLQHILALLCLRGCLIIVLSLQLFHQGGVLGNVRRRWEGSGDRWSQAPLFRRLGRHLDLARRLPEQA